MPSHRRQWRRPWRDTPDRRGGPDRVQSARPCAVGGDAVGDCLVGPVGHEDLEGLVDCSGHDRGGEGGVAAASDGEPFGLRFRQRKAEGDTEEVASLVRAAHCGLVLHPQLGPVEPIASASADWGPGNVGVKPGRRSPPRRCRVARSCRAPSTDQALPSRRRRRRRVGRRGRRRSRSRQSSSRCPSGR